MDSARERLNLRSLAPVFDPEHHSIYLEALEDALSDGSGMRNIALTGTYGTGKSSILSALAENYEPRLLVLSLSTLGGDDASDQQQPGGTTSSTTNRIQQEIVKQILYRDAPSQTRGSRFRRIARFVPTREAGVAIAIGLLVTAVLFLTGWHGPLSTSASRGWEWAVGEHAAVAVLVGLGVFGLRRWANGRLVLEKLNAGPATVSVAAATPSYFDQYMDEIIYYFEESGRDVVVFEDIDRFNDVHIFETLRALNTLLNNSAQVRKRKRHRRKGPAEDVPPVRFVYAMRDSIFEKIGAEPDPADAAEEEVQRANRTKFFDLVIPVVPFVTHSNARDVMTREFVGTDVSARLITLTAGHIADKRLILNLRNEYDVYANRLLHSASPVPGITPDKLLALLLYKSVHMADFEAIRTGKSRLDALHDAWRLIVDACTSETRAAALDASKRLRATASRAARAAELGARLQEVAEPALSPYSGRGFTIRVGNKAFSSQELASVDFWTTVARNGNNLLFASSGWNHNVPMEHGQLELLMDRSLDVDEWASSDQDEQRRRQKTAKEELFFLQHHSWEELHRRADLTAVVAGTTRENFSQIVDRVIGSRMARGLIAHGYIDDYFALYVSMYYGEHLRPDALNFVVHALDRGEPDFSYRLEPEDVEAVLRERGEDVLTDRAAYNTSILNHLLEVDEQRARPVARLVSAWGDADRKFAEEYVSAGRLPAAFVRLLAPITERIIPFVLEHPGVSDGARHELVDAALSHLVEGGTYESSSALPNYALEHYRKLPSLVEDVDGVQVDRVVSAIADASVTLPDVQPLTAAAQRLVLERGIYEVNERNLQTLGAQRSIALDALAARSDRLYSRALDHLSAYLRAVRDSEAGQVTVQDADCLSRVLHDVYENVPAASDAAPELIRLSAPDCTIDSLQEAPRSAWPALCANRRTVLTYENVLAYLDERGAFDESLLALIGEARTLEVPDEALLSDRCRVATAVINAGTVLADASLRVQLAESLGTGQLDPTDLRAEGGALAGLLIESGLLADSEETFSGSLMPDWSSREFAIARSSRFAVFCSPSALPAADLRSFFASSIVAPSLKERVLVDLAAYLVDAGSAAHDAAASYALTRRVRLDESALVALADGGASAPLVMEVLGRSSHLDTLAVQRVLRAMGGTYRAIADRSTVEATVPSDEAHKTVAERLRRAKLISGYRTKRGHIQIRLG